jgi:hypothetical protein
VFDEEEDEDSAYYKAQMLSATESSRGGEVELTITNLDYNISKKEWRKILAATFQPQVQVGLTSSSQSCWFYGLQIR